MVKILFIPFSIAASVVAGLAGKKLFNVVWTRIDRAELPQAERENDGWGKLIAANALQGAIFSSTRAASDRGARIAFQRATGRWPGESGDEASET